MRPGDFAPIPWAPYREPESEAFLRVKRSVLDSSYLSNNGANRWSLIPWTTLPNQSFPLYGNNQFDTPTTDPLGIYATMGYAQGVKYRTTKDDVRRGLSIARSRGVRGIAPRSERTSSSLAQARKNSASQKKRPAVTSTVAAFCDGQGLGVMAVNLSSE